MVLDIEVVGQVEVFSVNLGKSTFPMTYKNNLYLVLFFILEEVQVFCSYHTPDKVFTSY